ncbi:MAG: SDR family NAD(P)-dependent oxidoreductase [Acidimicrobiales bacterium]
MDLIGRRAVVTGGAGGIGAAIVADLTARGAEVTIWDLAQGVDITDRASVENAADAAEVDILVNAAGIDVIGPFLESVETDWERIVAVNLMGTLRCCHVVVPGMVERGRGTVVNIASDAGRVGSSGETVYAASKGGVIAFTKSLAREVAAAGIRANCVCPGPTDTSLLDQVAEYSQKLYDSLARAIPMKRIGTPDDVASVVAFLASDDAGFVTGQTVSVSGGLTMA